MLAAVDEEGHEPQAVAQSQGSVVDGEHSKGQLPVPVVLVSVGIGAQRISDEAVGPLHLGVGILARH
jgi:hypothetical protein